MTKTLVGAVPDFFEFYELVQRYIRERVVMEPTDWRETRQGIILGLLEQFYPKLLLILPPKFMMESHRMDEEKFWDWCMEHWED